MTEEYTLLGKETRYPTSYCPKILAGVPRYLNREIYDITQPDDLFTGFDSWHAYEASFITEKGLPVTGILKLVYNSRSPYIVESKSLKLYLNSFNMTPLGETIEKGITTFIQTVENDISSVVQDKVKACFYCDTSGQMPFDFNDYIQLESSSTNVCFSVYQENPGYLQENKKAGGELKVYSHLLKSNCKVTGQPDWGSIYIHLKADQLPDTNSLLKYIVSLRNENHFHEEICEMTFKRLTDAFSPEILAVTCLYTRRGGIDICPARANKPEYLPQHLQQPGILTQKGFRQ